MREKFKIRKEKQVGKIILSANTRAIWAVIMLFVLGDAAGLRLSGMSLAPRAVFANIAAIAVILLISFVYTYMRPRARIAGMTHMSAVILAFTCPAAVGSYIAAAVPRPLVDAGLAAADHALGLNWLASYEWVMAHPLIHNVLLLAYSTLIPQLLLVIFVLNFKGLCARGWETLWLFIVSFTGCLVLSGVWPAAGAFGYYHVEMNRAYVQVFLGLHDGIIKTIGDHAIQGVIQFPSFHVALGIVLTYAARGVRGLFPLLLGVNILLVLSTPAIGGHHFADVWGGAALALVSIWVVRRIISPRVLPEMQKITEA